MRKKNLKKIGNELIKEKYKNAPQWREPCQKRFPVIWQGLTETGKTFAGLKAKGANMYCKEYEVTGTAYSANITQTNPDGGTEQYSNVKLSGSYEFSVPIRRGSFDYYHAMILAQNNGSRGSITVTIYVNGKIFRTSTSNGAYVIASADGAVEYRDVE